MFRRLRRGRSQGIVNRLTGGRLDINRGKSHASGVSQISIPLLLAAVLYAVKSCRA